MQKFKYERNKKRGWWEGSVGMIKPLPRALPPSHHHHPLPHSKLCPLHPHWEREQDQSSTDTSSKKENIHKDGRDMYLDQERERGHASLEIVSRQVCRKVGGWASQERVGERERWRTEQCRSQTGCVFVCVEMHSSSFQARRSVCFGKIGQTDVWVTAVWERFSANCCDLLLWGSDSMLWKSRPHLMMLSVLQLCFVGKLYVLAFVLSGTFVIFALIFSP